MFLLLAPQLHGKKGPLTVSSAQYNSTLMRSFANAAKERGYEYRDINGPQQTGIYFKFILHDAYLFKTKIKFEYVIEKSMLSTQRAFEDSYMYSNSL